MCRNAVRTSTLLLFGSVDGNVDPLQPTDSLRPSIPIVGLTNDDWPAAMNFALASSRVLGHSPVDWVSMKGLEPETLVCEVDKDAVSEGDDELVPEPEAAPGVYDCGW